jgi:alpha-L-fucosidase
LRKRNIKVGAYYSLIDWSHPNYPGFLKDSSRYQVKNDSARWKQFISFNNNQIAEVSQLLHPDLWWFDGDWEHSAAEWNAPLIRENILKSNPMAIINGRLQGYGDYETPEQNIPVSKPKYPWWELCMTINNNWGYQPQDTSWKTPYEIITIFTDVISNGGNLLLDIGPKEDGTIPSQQLYLLKELGDWNKANAAAIFGTKSGIPPGHFYGATTLSKDSTKLYLFVAGNTNGPLLVKGLDNKINQIKILGSGKTLQHKVVGKISWSPVPGLVYIDIPKGENTKYMTVLELSLDKAVKLYRGKGGFD